MNSPFLMEFLKRQGTIVNTSRKTPETKPAKGSAPATPVPAVEPSMDIKDLAADKPSFKKVEEWFRNRIKLLEAQADA